MDTNLTSPNASSIAPTGAIFANGSGGVASTMSNSQSKLLGILNGDLETVKKPDPAVVTGPRLVNKVWRNLVKKYVKEGMSYEAIVTRILNYDGLIEESILTDEMIQKQKKP